MLREGIGGKLRSPAVYMECLRCQLFKGKLRKEWNRRATISVSVLDLVIIRLFCPGSHDDGE